MKKITSLILAQAVSGPSMDVNVYTVLSSDKSSYTGVKLVYRNISSKTMTIPKTIVYFKDRTTNTTSDAIYATSSSTASVAAGKTTTMTYYFGTPLTEKFSANLAFGFVTSYNGKSYTGNVLLASTGYTYCVFSAN